MRSVLSFVSKALDGERFVWLALALFALLQGSAALVQHCVGNSTIYDLGFFNQVLWNTLQGEWLFSSFKGFSLLGDHFSPILLALLPFYALWSGPETLLVVQSAALALSALPIFWLARDLCPNLRLANIWVLLYLAFPVLGYVGLFDYHPESFAPLLFGLALWFMHKRRLGALFVTALLILTIKEEMGLIVIMMGLYLAVFKGRPLAGLGLSALGAATFLVVMKLVMPAFIAPHNDLSGYLYLERYAHLGNSFAEVAQAAFLSPFEALRLSSSPFRILNLVLLFAFLGFLPLLGWRVLLMIAPLLGYSYLSSRSAQFDLRYQYLASTVPFLWLAALQGFLVCRARLGRLGEASPWPARLGRAARSGVWILVVGSLGMQIGWTRVSQPFTPRAPWSAVKEAAELVPPAASISVPNQYGVPFSSRANVYLVAPFASHRTHYERLRLSHTFDTDYILFDDSTAAKFLEYEKRKKEIAGRADYRRLFERDGVSLYKRERPRPLPAPPAAW